MNFARVCGQQLLTPVPLARMHRKLDTGREVVASSRMAEEEYERAHYLRHLPALLLACCFLSTILMSESPPYEVNPPDDCSKSKSIVTGLNVE